MAVRALWTAVVFALALSPAAAQARTPEAAVTAAAQRRALATFGTLSDNVAAAEDEQGTAGFYEGNSADASSSATQSSELAAVAAAPEIVASGSAGGSAARTFGAEQAAWAAYNGHSSVFMRFTVVDAAVSYSAQGTLATGSPSNGNGSFILYRTSGGFQQIERFENQAFSASGTLAPGTYEMGSGASCSGDQPSVCTASFDLSFDVDP